MDLLSEDILYSYQSRIIFINLKVLNYD